MNGTQIIVKSKCYLNIGGYATFYEKQLRIVKRKISIENSIVVYEYYLKNEIIYEHFDNYNITGVSLHGYVEETKNYRVKICLDIDKKRGEYWFKYATPYSSGGNGGWYAMPEIGDDIRISIPDFDHNAYAIGAVNDVESEYRQIIIESTVF